MITPLYQPISPALTTLFGSIDGHAKAGAPVFCGSAGSITKRTNQHGLEYYVHRFYGGDGKQHENYIGTAKDNEQRIGVLNEQIAEVKALLPDLRLLLREGFQSADSKTYATLASLHTHGLFTAGATLIGSHAFGVLINQMGIRAAAYATEDVDVARQETLAFERLPEKPFLEMLRDSGIHFVEVPQLDVRQPSTSFKQMGVSRFHVDLLVPSMDNEMHLVAVPELKAHATALPYLSYALGQTQMATLLSKEGCCPVRVPVAERFAVHKLVVSQLRTNRDAKADKDIFQASVMLAALGEMFPGAIESAVADLPVSARRYLVSASKQVLPKLENYPRAAEELQEAIERSEQIQTSEAGDQSLAEQWKAKPAMSITIGVIKAVSETEVIQDAGRGCYVVWPRDQLAGVAVSVGDKVEISRDGAVTKLEAKTIGLGR